jgi:hypothetical protein
VIQLRRAPTDPADPPQQPSLQQPSPQQPGEVVVAECVAPTGLAPHTSEIAKTWLGPEHDVVSLARPGDDIRVQYIIGGVVATR